MLEEKEDRRVQRTKQLLHKALVHLIREKSYDVITIQDITEEANLGRTTFYLHYDSKEALLLAHYTDLLELLELERWSKDELLCKSEARGLIRYLELVSEHQSFFLTIRSAKDSDSIMRGIQAQLVRNLVDSLAHVFPDSDSRLPLPVLCNYITGAQLSLIEWWMLNRNNYGTQQIAHMIQRLQYVAIKEAFHLE